MPQLITAILEVFLFIIGGIVALHLTMYIIQVASAAIVAIYRIGRFLVNIKK